MKHFIIALVIIVCSAQVSARQNKPDRPKLVVGVVIDQMRYDYLYRFHDRYGDDGFKRLLSHGFSCENTEINYIPTFTAPGHACIYTGSVPAIHGIAGNDWIDNETCTSVYCVEDTSVTALAGAGKAGLMSPRNLLSSTIADELKLATNFRSKVFGISLKDRGAVIPAGHLGNGAYWYDDASGTLISSSYYGRELPQWLVNFNNQKQSDSFIRQDWNTLYPIATYTQSSPDDNRYEGTYKGEQRPVFPHKGNTQGKFSHLRRIPAGNTYTLNAARACIEGELLGADAITDFLAVSLSTTDYIGHQFGPNAVEIEDMYLRLDSDLAAFITYLDKKVGEGQYLLFLTADHGGAHNAQFLRDNNLPGGSASQPRLAQEISKLLHTDFPLRQSKGADLLVAVSNDQVYLNEEAILANGYELKQIKARIKHLVERQPEIAYVLDMSETGNAAIPEKIKKMAINGYNRLRSGQLFIIYHPGWYAGYSPTGTTHGTWHPYDAHIPLLWYGWKLPKGTANRTIHMEDIAATLAALLRIQMPNGCIGEVISEVVNK